MSTVAAGALPDGTPTIVRWCAERVLGECGQRKIAVASTGLDRAEVRLGLDALDLLTKPDEPGIGVDVLPAQAGDLTATQAREDEEDRWPGGPLRSAAGE